MKKSLASLVAVALVLFCAAAPEPTQVRGKVLTYGIMTTPGAMSESKASSNAGKSDESKLQIKSATNRIPATLHTKFGFIYSLTNLPIANGNLTVTRTIKHPKMKRPSGESPIGFVSEDSVVVHNGGAIEITGYSFDNEFELVPGTWDFEIKYKDNLICTQRFTVFKP